MTLTESTHTFFHAPPDEPFVIGAPTSISFPRYAGYWQHGNTTLAMNKKPRWLTRIMMRLVFETTWKDNTDASMMTYYYCSECDNTVTFGHECKAFITPPDIKKELIMNERKSDEFNEQFYNNQTSMNKYRAYTEAANDPHFMQESEPMSPQGYVDPASKYYIDRMWEEYHKMKEELADTKSKLGQLEDYISETLKPELAETKSKLKMAQSAWDELDKSHAERAKLHDELVIAADEFEREYLRVAKDFVHLRAERYALKTFVSAFTQWSSKYNAYNAVPIKDARADFETLMEAYNALMMQS